MPDMSHASVRGRLLKSLGNAIAEMEQIIRDIGWWNNNRTDCPPFDAEATRVALSKARQVHAIVEADKGPIPDDLWNDLIKALHEDAYPCP